MGIVGAAAIAVVVVLVFGSPFGSDPVTRSQIEQAVAKKPSGDVQVVLCNEEIIPSENPKPDPPHTWTCDTYLGPNKLDAQNGPSYEVIVTPDRDHIESIRRVPTH